MSTQSQTLGPDEELVGHKGSILKINTNHFGLNKNLESRELISKSKLQFNLLKTMINLDYEKGSKYRIILEGGKLLCNFLEIIRERDNLIVNCKSLIETCIKNSFADPSALEKLVNIVAPTLIINPEDSVHGMPNPILPILTDSLFYELKKVKDMMEHQKEMGYDKDLNETKMVIGELSQQLKEKDKLCKSLQSEVKQLTKQNEKLQNQYYVIELSKQELIKMRGISLKMSQVFEFSYLLYR